MYMILSGGEGGLIISQTQLLIPFLIVILKSLKKTLRDSSQRPYLAESILNIFIVVEKDVYLPAI